MAKGELDNALSMLLEAERKIKVEDIDPHEYNTVALVLYNLAILHFIQKSYLKSVEGFNSTINYINEKEKIDGGIVVLNILEFNEKGELAIRELKEGDSKYTCIDCKTFAEKNVQLIRLHKLSL